MDALKKELEGKSAFFGQIQKLFFKKFPYRIVIHLDSYSPKTESGKAYVKKWDDSNVWEAACLGILERCTPKFRWEWKYRIRSADDTVTFYFENEDDALALIRSERDHIYSVDGPAKTGQLVAMQNTSAKTQVIVRKTLFWSKYRWAVVLKPVTRARQAEITEWMVDTMDYDPQAPNERMWANWGRTTRVYFASEQDALMFFMGVSPDVDYFEKALLEQEISDESDTFAQAY